MNKTQFEFPPCPECGTNGPIQNDITGTKFCNNENCNVWFYWDNGCVHHEGKNTKEIEMSLAALTAGIGIGF